MIPEGLSARIGGRDRTDGTTEPTVIVDPANQHELAVVGAATINDIDEAAQAAATAWQQWREVSSARRADALRAVARSLRADAEALALIICAETGKLLTEARAEVEMSCRYLDWFASVVPDDEPVRVSAAAMVARRPVGVVGAIATWNFPLSIPVRKLAASLSAGCSVVLKPSPLAPITAHALVRHLEGHLPVGTVNLVLGAEAEGRALVEHELVKSVTFTGSTHNGADVAARASTRMTRSLLELGGRAPVVVLPGADVDQAVETIMTAKFRNNGASCIAANNVFVHQDALAEVFARLGDRVRALRPGDPRSSTTTLGPHRTEQLAQRMRDLAEAAAADGCPTVGGREADEESPCFVPAVLVAAEHDTGSWETEVFGPLLQVRGYRDADQVADIVNSWQRGLGGYVVGRDPGEAADYARRLRIGIVGVGTGSPNAPELPFGGFDRAGWGREGSAAGLDPFLEYQTIAFSTESEQ